MDCGKRPNSYPTGVVESSEVRLSKWRRIHVSDMMVLCSEELIDGQAKHCCQGLFSN